MTVPTMYRVQAAVREWVAGITVAQFDQSPATEYKLSLRLHTAPLTNPSVAPSDWHDPDEAYGVKGLWIGKGGTVEPAAGLYLLAEAQLVSGVWSQPRDIGIIFVAGDADAAAAPAEVIDGGEV